MFPPYKRFAHSTRRLNIIVTGGSSGIGNSIVRKFATEGHNVLGTYFSNRNSVEEITKKYSNVEFCELDQGDFESVEHFAEYAKSWLSRVDVKGEGKEVKGIGNFSKGRRKFKIFKSLTFDSFYRLFPIVSRDNWKQTIK